MEMKDIEMIEKWIHLFESSSLTRLKIEGKGLEVEMEKAAGPVPVQKEKTAAAEGKPLSAEKLHTITSPLVGTFYAAPAPDEPAFVTEGSAVAEDTPVGLVESMKVFTEVSSGVKGVIAEVLVKNGDFVEYDQPLFRVKGLKA